MKLREKQDESQNLTSEEEEIVKSCEYCNGFGVVKSFTREGKCINRPCPICGSSNDFNKMVGTPEFDLKK